MDIDDVQSKASNDSKNTAKMPTATMEGVDIDNTLVRVRQGDETNDNPQVNQGGDTNEAEMSTAPQPLTTAMKETPAPLWLGRMLVYLRGISDNAEWQGLVSALLRFENLNPSPGVSTPLLNYDVLSDLICSSPLESPN
jgi:hypothetical protein